MTINIGLTSRACLRALFALRSSLLHRKLSSVMLVFTCTQKFMYSNDGESWLSWREREGGREGERERGREGERERGGERERVADTESENHLETLGQGFATLQVIACQNQNSQTLVHLGHRMNCNKPRKSQKKEKKIDAMRDNYESNESLSLPPGFWRSLCRLQDQACYIPS